MFFCPLIEPRSGDQACNEFKGTGELLPFRAEQKKHLREIRADLSTRLRRRLDYRTHEAAELFLQVINRLLKLNDTETKLSTSVRRIPYAQKRVGSLSANWMRASAKRQKAQKAQIEAWLRLRGTRIVQAMDRLNIENDALLMDLLPGILAKQATASTAVPSDLELQGAQRPLAWQPYEPREEEYRVIAWMLRKLGPDADFEQVSLEIDESCPENVGLFAPEYREALRPGLRPRMKDALKDPTVKKNFMLLVRRVRKSLKNEGFVYGPSGRTSNEA
jgi:hypothetical protein